MTTAQTGLELEDFLPQPPEQLGSQASATRPSSMVCFLKALLKMILYGTLMVDACPPLRMSSTKSELQHGQEALDNGYTAILGPQP